MQVPNTPSNDTEYVRVVEKPTFEGWVKMGISLGYCTDIYCDHHQAHAPEDEEVFHQLLEEYEARDFCWPVVRLKTLAEDD